MASEENVEIMRRAWDAWLRRDFDAMAALWDPDVVWRTEHFHDWPESAYRGHEGIRQFLSEWLDVWGDYEVSIDEIIAAPDGRIVSLFTHKGTGKQSGVPMEVAMAQIATLRNGKIIEFDNYDRPAEALEAAGVSE